MPAILLAFEHVAPPSQDCAGGEHTCKTVALTVWSWASSRELVRRASVGMSEKQGPVTWPSPAGTDGLELQVGLVEEVAGWFDRGSCRLVW